MKNHIVFLLSLLTIGEIQSAAGTISRLLVAKRSADLLQKTRPHMRLMSTTHQKKESGRGHERRKRQSDDQWGSRWNRYTAYSIATANVGVVGWTLWDLYNHSPRTRPFPIQRVVEKPKPVTEELDVETRAELELQLLLKCDYHSPEVTERYLPFVKERFTQMCESDEGRRNLKKMMQKSPQAASEISDLVTIHAFDLYQAQRFELLEQALDVNPHTLEVLQMLLKHDFSPILKAIEGRFRFPRDTTLNFVTKVLSKDIEFFEVLCMMDRESDSHYPFCRHDEHDFFRHFLNKNPHKIEEVAHICVKHLKHAFDTFDDKAKEKWFRKSFCLSLIYEIVEKDENMAEFFADIVLDNLKDFRYGRARYVSNTVLKSHPERIRSLPSKSKLHILEHRYEILSYIKRKDPSLIVYLAENITKETFVYLLKHSFLNSTLNLLMQSDPSVSEKFANLALEFFDEMIEIKNLCGLKKIAKLCNDKTMQEKFHQLACTHFASLVDYSDGRKLLRTCMYTEEHAHHYTELIKPVLKQPLKTHMFSFVNAIMHKNPDLAKMLTPYAIEHFTDLFYGLNGDRYDGIKFLRNILQHNPDVSLEFARLVAENLNGSICKAYQNPLLLDLGFDGRVEQYRRRGGPAGGPF